jgi:hypothetical protein
VGRSLVWQTGSFIRVAFVFGGTRIKVGKQIVIATYAMATAIFVNSMTPLPSDAQQSRPVLRRATYIHISDLTSAYNIDHVRLEQELARVKVENEATSRSTAVGTTEKVDDPTSGASTLEMDSTAVMPLPQKRLQPPRGGYNLCV